MQQPWWSVLWAVVVVVSVALSSSCGTHTPTDRIAGVADLTVDEPRRVDYGDDPAQYGWLRAPSTSYTDEPAPIVVLVHGGFWSEPWDYTLMEPMAQALAAQELASWNIEFRRLGGRGGWPATFDDVSAAIAHLEVLSADYPIDLERVVIAGHSSGGHLALWAVGTNGDHVSRVAPAAAVGIAAITDLSAVRRTSTFLGGTPETVPDRWAFAAPSLDPGLVRLVHGVDDDVVPLASTQQARRSGVDIVELDGADHFAVIEPGAALDAVVEEIVRSVDALNG